MQKTATDWRTVVFWGAVWGILEATVGALLHLLPVNVGWAVWLPLAMGCMLGAYRATGSASSVMWVAVVAAAFKLTNLLFPIRADHVLNPAVSILLEGLSLAAVLALARGIPRRRASRALAALGANTLWRGLYLVYLLFVPRWMREISVLASEGALARHLVWENLATSLAVFALMALASRRERAAGRLPRRFPAALLAAMCAANLVLQWTL